MANSGCLLAGQTVELYVKALLRLKHKSKDIHYLPKLLTRGRQYFPYFNDLLTEPKLSYFIQNLTLVYTAMRFGEGRSNVKNAEVIQVLDEVVYN
jgi:HEPN domain-containing protein